MVLANKDVRHYHTLLRAFRHRNFRLFLTGQSLSLIGTWVQQVTIGWLVYRLTGSVFLLGLTGFASQIPILLLAPVAGVLSDKFCRRKILLVTQILALVQALAMAYLTWRGLIQIWHVMVLAVAWGLITTFEIPARQSFMGQLVNDKADLPNAIALNSFIVNSARLIGPTIAGIAIPLFGETICFLINGASYVTIIVALLLIRVAPKESIRKNITNSFASLMDGFTYAFDFFPVRALLLLVGVASFMVLPYLVLMPIFAAEVFHGNAYTFGLLMAPAGLGAMLGNIYLASRKSVYGLCKITMASAMIAGGALMGFSQSHVFWVSMTLMTLVGFGVIVQVVSSNMVIQTLVDEDKRGRVMSLYSMAYLGMAPLGNLIAGSAANYIGAPDTLLLGGLCYTVAALIFARKLKLTLQLVEPVYVLRGVVGTR